MRALVIGRRSGSPARARTRRHRWLAFCCLVAIAAVGLADDAETTMQAPTDAQTAALADAERRLSEYLEQTRTLRARFDQLLLDPAGEVLQRSEGELMIRRPGRFRWEYKSPYEQLIVADGERLWLYEPDLEQVTVRPQDDTLDNTPASLLSGGGDFTAHYRLTDVATTDDGLRAIRLEPRSAGGDFRYLALGFDEGDELKRMELVDRLDQLTRIEFSAVRRGGRLRARLFEFEPPDGVDVIETNGLSPGGVPLSDVPAGQAPVDAPPRR